MNPVAHRPDLRRIGESAFTEVVLVFLSLPVTVRSAVKHTALPTANDQIVSRVALVGPQLSGTVEVHLPLAFVVLAVRRLTGLEGTAQATDAVLADAAGELANMVAGRVAAQLAVEGFPCKLDTPSVSRGIASPGMIPPGADHARADFTCEGHALSLAIQCAYLSP